MFTASARLAPDWHEHAGAHLLPLIPILSVINGGCDKRERNEHCNIIKEQNLFREASRLNSERFKQYDQARHKQVYA